jgi:hypothetical protein
MAQTTGAVCQSGYKIEISADGSTWKDISGVGVGIAVSGGDAQVGEQMTALGEFSLVVPGNKIAPYDITIRSVYTETADEAFLVAFAAFEGASKMLAARWAPKGTGATSLNFSTSIDGAGVDIVPIVSCTPPEQDASEGKPAIFEIVLKSPALYKGTIGA